MSLSVIPGLFLRQKTSGAGLLWEVSAGGRNACFGTSAGQCPPCDGSGGHSAAPVPARCPLERLMIMERPSTRPTGTASPSAAPHLVVTVSYTQPSRSGSWTHSLIPTSLAVSLYTFHARPHVAPDLGRFLTRRFTPARSTAAHGSRAAARARFTSGGL